MSIKKTIYESRSKIFYEGPLSGTLIQHFKDSFRSSTTTERSKPDVIFGKGVMTNRISAYLMTQLDEIGVPTHFIKAMNMREQLVWDIGMFPFEVIVHNLANKEMSKRFGLTEGMTLPRSIVEFAMKDEKRGYPTISEEHIIAFGWASEEELSDIYDMAMRINDFLSGLFLGINLKLVDVKLEFGRLSYDDEDFVILGDEISPDNCRLWQLNEKKEIDKKALGKDLNTKINHYQDIANRLGLLPEGTLTPDTKVSMELLDKLTTADNAGDHPKPIKPSPIKKK